MAYLCHKLPHLTPRDTDSDKDKCWTHYGRRDPDGYSTIRIFGREYRLHRLVYEFFNRPLDPGSVVRHKCNCPSCFNPEHLIHGTPADNTADRLTTGRSSRKLRPDQVRLIRELHKEGLSSGQIAQEVGCTASAVRHIVSGRRHKQVA